MIRLDRRSFLLLTSGSLATLATLRKSALAGRLSSVDVQRPNTSCWLDVCAAFIVEDPKLDIHSEIVLTSDSFVGAKGFADGADATEYEIHLYDADGNAVGADGVARRLTVPAMQTTVLKTSELLGTRKAFWGGLKVRLRPRCRQTMHASDLFSSAFVRWNTPQSFDNVHANPDPLEWQKPDSFFYSMPFPPLDSYEGLFSLFNPYAARSKGSITLYDQLGTAVDQIPYDLGPHASLLLDLRRGSLVSDVGPAFTHIKRANEERPTATPKGRGGTIGVINEKGSMKNFGYLMMRQHGRDLFSVEHPIHQPPFAEIAAKMPFDVEGRFTAKNILYTPLVFHQAKIAGVTLTSRFHFSSGAPIEPFLWLNPLVTDREGNVVWQVTPMSKFPSSINTRQVERGVLKLAPYQSCVVDTSDLHLQKNFSGGLLLAVAPTTNHTLMKVEISVSEWNSSSFTHFRPGLAAARSYQKSPSREGLATDYIASSARFEMAGGRILRDEIIAIINVDDKSVIGNPVLEIFSAKGLVATSKIGEIPAFGCRHYLLSSMLFEKSGEQDLTLRLVDERATLLMSVVHIDYNRRDIALDHGSDRFSTFRHFTCEPKV